MRLRGRYISVLAMGSFFLLLFSCGTTNKVSYQRTGEVQYVSSDTGTITVDSKGYASDLSTAVYYAERNALENILFKGIPGSNQRQPLIPNENKSWESHAAVLNKLLSEDYPKYIMNSETLNVSNSGAVSLQRTITFDINALRKYLEIEGVIRKFGF